MSIEATWDLRVNASPRSLCVFGVSSSQNNDNATTTASSSSKNPFDAAALERSTSSTISSNDTTTTAVVGAVFGTDAGSLHYRAFAPPSSSSRGGGKSGSSSRGGLSMMSGGVSTSASLGPSSSSASVTGTTSPFHIQVPLGYGKATTQLPRSYYPMDLIKKSSLLPGAIVECLSLSSNNNCFLLLLDDHRPASSIGAFCARIVNLHPTGGFHVSSTNLPRMSSAAFTPATGVVYSAGRNLVTLSRELWEHEINHHAGFVDTSIGISSSSRQQQQQRRLRGTTTSSSSKRHHNNLVYNAQLPAPGSRSGHAALCLANGGTLAVVAVDNSFWALPGIRRDPTTTAAGVPAHNTATKILSLTQSPSQVHPVIVLDVEDASLQADWSCLFLANGRECAVVDVHYYDFGSSNNNNNNVTGGGGGGSGSGGGAVLAKLRNTACQLTSPMLAAAASWPFIALLTSDGLVSLRCPSCVAVPLKTVEVGQPNDYFCLNTLFLQQHNQPLEQHSIMAIAYSGEAKVLRCPPDSAQDLADRLMRLSIDAFGDAFPRKELANAVQASFTATSYVSANEASLQARQLLQQYLQAALGLADWESGGASGWPTELSAGILGGGGEGHHHGTWHASNDSNHYHRSNSKGGRGIPPTVISAATPASLLTGSALLCLVCIQLSQPNAGLANRAAKACAEKMGVVISGNVNDAAVSVCEQVADKLLREASSSFTLLSGSSPTPVNTRGVGHRTTQAALYVDFVEACIWLLRGCGMHERAMEIAYDKLCRQQQQQAIAASDSSGIRGHQHPSHGWSQIKYESYTATHLSELWATQTETGCQMVLTSAATHRLLEHNPRLGLSVFCSVHPQNEAQWRAMRARDDPLAHPKHAKQVVQLLQSIHPSVPYDQQPQQSNGISSTEQADEESLPLHSGRNLAIAYLESAIGILTGRPTEEDEFDSLPPDKDVEERIANFHDELSLLLLEGVIAERQDDKDGDDTELGTLYRLKLKRLLRWPIAKIRSDHFLKSLPPSFLQEKASVLGRLGRHEDALAILYRDLRSLDLALEYCDHRHEQLKAKQERARIRHQQQQHHHPSSMFQDHVPNESDKNQGDNAYLPLVRVALEEESQDPDRGTAAAIQVLALRRSAIDRAAALRLLPSDIAVSAVARPFLIPALVDSESQVRRLTVVSALLRARYLRLQGQLTAAQLKAQANLHVVPQLRSLHLGDPLHSTNPFRARTSTPIGSTMPDVYIVKHFFPRHLVIQAKVINSVGLAAKYARTLSDIAFVVAESSEEAIQPLLQVPIQVLPSKMTGCAWCVLSASPARMDGPTAQLTCELRYTVRSVEASSSSLSSNAAIVVPPLSTGVMGRTYVEELQDLEVHAAHFS